MKKIKLVLLIGLILFIRFIQIENGTVSFAKAEIDIVNFLFKPVKLSSASICLSKIRDKHYEAITAQAGTAKFFPYNENEKETIHYFFQNSFMTSAIALNSPINSTDGIQEINSCKKYVVLKEYRESRYQKISKLMKKITQKAIEKIIVEMREKAFDLTNSANQTIRNYYKSQFDFGTGCFFEVFSIFLWNESTG
jgi:hypothetical protein